MDQFSEHRELVRGVFRRVASKYDVMNDVMSFGLHRFWKRMFVSRVCFKPNALFMDLAAGTGDITRLMHKEIVKRGGTPNIVAVDPSVEMITNGKARLIDKGIVTGVEWVVAPAEQLPFAANSVDVITIAFGLRNVSDIEAALRECLRVLKPGGQFLCLEFSKVNHQILRKAYKLYSHSLIPRLGKWIAQDTEAYEYLVESIDAFLGQDALKQMLENVGFKSATYTNLTDGIVAIHEGWKE
jgi:demethylmenaquinone methyltransferase / 2-methoxy-6-polyprenyl-1,4-benzoquinol methylase